jgi:hypothetical protein
MLALHLSMPPPGARRGNGRRPPGTPRSRRRSRRLEIEDLPACELPSLGWQSLGGTRVHQRRQRMLHHGFGERARRTACRSGGAPFGGDVGLPAGITRVAVVVAADQTGEQRHLPHSGQRSGSSMGSAPTPSWPSAAASFVSEPFHEVRLCGRLSSSATSGSSLPSTQHVSVARRAVWSSRPSWAGQSVRYRGRGS